jgi:hypothetical protein
VGCWRYFSSCCFVTDVVGKGGPDTNPSSTLQIIWCSIQMLTTHLPTQTHMPCANPLSETRTPYAPFHRQSEKPSANLQRKCLFLKRALFRRRGSALRCQSDWKNSPITDPNRQRRPLSLRRQGRAACLSISQRRSGLQHPQHRPLRLTHSGAYIWPAPFHHRVSSRLLTVLRERQWGLREVSPGRIRIHFAGAR